MGLIPTAVDHYTLLVHEIVVDCSWNQLHGSYIHWQLYEFSRIGRYLREMQVKHVTMATNTTRTSVKVGQLLKMMVFALLYEVLV